MYPPPSDTLPSSAPSVFSKISTLAPSASISQAAHPTASVSQISDLGLLRQRLITLLEIDPAFTNRSKAIIIGLTLIQSWGWYSRIINTIHKHDLMVKDKSWSSTGIPALADKDIIELFIGKSYFYNNWFKVFGAVVENHSVMHDWLELKPDCKSDLEVWGIDKRVDKHKHPLDFTLVDLKFWLTNGGTLKPRKKDRGSSKAEEKKDKGKGKQKESSGSGKKDKHRISLNR